MQCDRDEQLLFVRYGRLPRPPDAPPRRWRRAWRRRAAAGTSARLVPASAPLEPARLDIHEYLELEFAVGQERRR
jgi:hypothetical protein